MINIPQKIKQIITIFFLLSSLILMTDGKIFASYKGLRLNPAKSIQPKTLTNHNGEEISFPSANGKYQLVFFGYTSCPDVCPTALIKIKQVINSLKSEGRVQYNFISIDVERDNPELLKSFVGFYHPKITGITGNIHNIKAIEKEFGILTRKFQGKSALAYKLEHTVFLYLIDPSGNLILMYPGSANATQIVTDLKILLEKPLQDTH